MASLVRQRNAIAMTFRWWANDGPLFKVFGSSLPSPGSAHVTVAKSLGVRHGVSCQTWPCALYTVPIFSLCHVVSVCEHCCHIVLIVL